MLKHLIHNYNFYFQVPKRKKPIKIDSNKPSLPIVSFIDLDTTNKSQKPLSPKDISSCTVEKDVTVPTSSIIVASSSIVSAETTSINTAIETVNPKEKEVEPESNLQKEISNVTKTSVSTGTDPFESSNESNNLSIPATLTNKEIKINKVTIPPQKVFMQETAAQTDYIPEPAVSEKETRPTPQSNEVSNNIADVGQQNTSADQTEYTPDAIATIIGNVRINVKFSYPHNLC